MEKNIIDLEMLDNVQDSGVFELALVDEPAINKIWIAMANQKFVNPSGGESEDEFIPRCIAKLVGDEGYETDQAAAICYSTWQSHSAVKLNDAFLWPDFASEEFAETYTDYPEGAVNNAKRALEWADKNGWGDCGMGPGKARANQLANREPISEDTIARMSAFERHRQNSETPYSEGCGKLMWDAWGGDAGIRWAYNKLREIRGEEFSYDTSALPAYTDEIPKEKTKLAAESYPTIEEAVERSKELGLKGEIHSHESEDGFIYMPGASHADLEKALANKGEKMSKFYFASEDQQILVGPVAIPDLEIIRQEEKTKKPYWVRFSAHVISRMAEKFMKENRNNETNIQHDNKVDAKSYIYESWIVESEDDKANSIYNLSVPVGTWVVKMRVTDPEVWKQVKSGELNGFSLEGNFIDKKELDQMNKDKSIYEKIIKILKSV